MMVCMTDTKTVKKFMKMLKDAGCECSFDLKMGVAHATDDGRPVYSAIQKGKGGRWIVRCQDNSRLKFS